MRLIGFKAHVVPALAVLLCLLVGLPTGVSAQTETSRTLVGGQTIAWTDPWKLNSELTTSGDGFDLLAVETLLGLVGVGSYGYPIAGSEVRDIAIEAFAGEVGLRQVDRGDYETCRIRWMSPTRMGSHLDCSRWLLSHPMEHCCPSCWLRWTRFRRRWYPRNPRH